jgi:hypothetical protein
MSEVGQTPKCPGSRGMSVLPSGADVVGMPRHVRLVPIGDIAKIKMRWSRPDGVGAHRLSNLIGVARLSQ